MTAGYSKWRWAAVSVFMLAAALNYLDRSLLGAVFPTLLKEFGVAIPALGLLVAVFYIFYAVGAVVFGVLIDRVGLTPVLVAALVLWSMASIATGWTHGFAELLGCRAVLGFAESAIIPASGKIFATYLLPRERTLGTALTQIGISVGTIAAPLVTAGLAGYGWRMPFLAAGVGGLVWIPLWLSVGRVSPASTPPMGTDRELMGNPKLWALVVANLLVMTVYGLWGNWTTLYLVRERGMTQVAANFQLAWLPPLFATVGGLVGGWLAFWLAGRGMAVQKARLRVCFVGAGLQVLTAGIPWMPSAEWAAAGISLSLFCCVFMSVNIYAMPLDLFGAARAAVAIAVLTSAYGIYLAVQGQLVGLLWQFGLFRPVCVLSAIAPLAAVALLWAANVADEAAN